MWMYENKDLSTISPFVSRVPLIFSDSVTPKGKIAKAICIELGSTQTITP